MTHLLHPSCRTTEPAGALNDAAVHDHLAQSSGWRASAGAIEKTYAFKNFLETMACAAKADALVAFVG